MAGRFGHGQVAHQGQGRQAGETFRIVKQVGERGGGEAQTVHAGVHLHQAFHQHVVGLGKPPPGFDLSGGAQHWQKLVGREVALRTGVGAMHDDDAWGRPGDLAQGDAFVQVGHIEAGAAGAQERARHGLEAEAIGIGFDHGAHVGAGRFALQEAPILDQRRKIDGQKGAGAVFGTGGKGRGARLGHAPPKHQKTKAGSRRLRAPQPNG